MPKRDSTANLIQNQGRSTPEERREIAVKAGIASGIARRQRRQMRAVMGDLMTANVTEDAIRERLEAAGLEPTHETAIAFSAIVKASHGDIEAARFVRDTLGEKPTESFNLSVGEKPIKSLDLSGMTDDELERLADQADAEDRAALPAAAFRNSGDEE